MSQPFEASLPHRFNDDILDEPVVYTPGEKRAAALYVCDRCNTITEAEELIDMLGLRDAD